MIAKSRPLVWLGVVLAILATLAWRFLTFTGFTNDHYVHLARAQQMLLGDWPVRDFVDPGMPLMYVVSALARVVAGRALGVELAVVSVAFAIGAAFTAAAAARLSGSVVVAVAVTLIEIIVSPRSFGYPKIALYAIAAWAFLRIAGGPTRGRIVWLAVLIATAFLFRHDHGLYIGIGSVVVVTLGRWREGMRAVASGVLILATSVALLLLPWALYVQYYAGLAAYFRSGAEFSRHEADATLLRELPRIELGAEIFTRSNAEAWIFYAFYAIPVMSLAAAWYRSRRGRDRWPGELAAVAAIAVVALLTDFGFLRDTLTARIPDAVALPMVLASWLISLSWSPSRPVRKVVYVAVAVVLAAITVRAVGVAASFEEQIDRTRLLARPGAMSEHTDDLLNRLRHEMPERDHVPSRYARALMPFFEYVNRCTSTQDRLIVTSLLPEVYVLSGRGFGGGHMAYMPGYYSTEADQAGVIARLRRQSVPIVIMVLEEDLEFREKMGILSGYIEEHYAPFATLDVPPTPGLRLYGERSRSTGVDAATGWPCFSATKAANAAVP